MPINLETCPLGTETELTDGTRVRIAGRGGSYVTIEMLTASPTEGWPVGERLLYDFDGIIAGPTREFPRIRVAAVGLSDIPERPRERERLPFDPMQPVELEDGTPIRLLSADMNRPTSCWKAMLLADSVDLGGAGCVFNYTRKGGFSDGTPNGSPLYPRIVNVDPSVSPALRKARREYRNLDESEKPDWLGEDWYAPYADIHFAQLVDENEVAMVSFYENERKLEADRRTTMRVGRYVRRFSGGKLKDEDVERVSAASDVKLRGNRVKITQDADEIESIYVHGPRSCMAGRARQFNTDGIHPARVYAGPDLAVAYLGELDDPSARAVVWPERKLYSSIYGDVSRMRRMLESMGYAGGDMDGARVRLIECDYGIVMPYVDGADGGRADYENNVVVLGGGEVETVNTNGLGRDCSRTTCERCDDRVSDDETSCVEVARHCAETWCDHCVDHYATYCEHYGACVADEEVTEVHNACGPFMHPSWDLDDYREVEEGEHAGEWWHVDMTGEGVDGTVWHVDELPEPDAEIVPTLPKMSLAEAEAAGQMRLPLMVSGRYRLMLEAPNISGPVACSLAFATGDEHQREGSFDECERVLLLLAERHPDCRYWIEPVPALEALEALAIAA